MAHSPHRIYTFDLLRGLAVLTMMLAHGIYFFHVRDNSVLIGLENFGNTVSFITFLVVSGAVTWIALLGDGRGDRPINRRRVASRVGTLLLAYYILALIASGPAIWNAAGLDRLRLIGNLLSFRTLPGFMEYFPPFIFYSAAVGFFPSIFAWVSRRFRYVVVASALAYFGGSALAQLSVNAFWQPWVALVAGGDGLFRFPFLQYFPIFFLGLFWGHQTIALEGLSVKRELVSQLGWLSVYTVLCAYLITTFTDISLTEMFSRWPPSLPFLALGLVFSFFAANLLYRLRQLRAVPLLRDGLLVLGQNALGLFWSHIFLLKLYEMAGGAQVSSPLIVFGLFGLLLLVTVALTTFLPFNRRFALTLYRGSHEEHEEALEKESVVRLARDIAADTTAAANSLRRYFMPNPQTHSARFMRRRHQFGLGLLAIIGASLVFPIASEELALQRQERGSDVWWNQAAPYRQPLTLQNTESFVNLPVGTTVAIRINHRTLVDQAKSQTDGQDLRIVYWNGNEHLVLNNSVLNPNSTDTVLTFRLPAQIEGKKPKQFYTLYYGEFVAESVPTPRLDTSTYLSTRFGAEESLPLISAVSKSWNLIGQPGNEYATLTVTSTTERPTATVTYKVLETNLTGVMLPTSPTTWTASIPTDTLPAGTYRLQATLTEVDGKTSSSTISGFHRSHPLYVAWTQDWEGYEAKQSYLDAIEAIATQYKMPITHFVNPSIYVSKTIKPQRAQALTQWIQRRLTLGDGLGLHLHLFHDFVEQAGIEVRKEPNWGDRGDGYGVPLSAYTADEQETLISYALDLMFANGLPQTKMFRAGGWFANLDTLKALERLGFTVDSSARTKYTFGRNRLPGHWDVSPTMQPYYPSRTNQNIPGERDPFPILEIPNNGADSYAFSTAAMIERFTLNFKTGILQEPQQLTYLSHPHWFDEKEQARVREVFDYISRYTFSSDQGPVIFTKTETIAEIWDDLL